MSCEGCEEGAYVIDALAKLLAEIAVIVNGPEPPLTRWSYHDLPEKVRALKQAPPAAAVPDYDDASVDIGGKRVPLWVVAYAEALHEYMTTTTAGGPWAIGRVQSRNEAPPAAAVPDGVARDAARYRWLRNDSGNSFDDPVIQGKYIGSPKADWLTGEHADEAIDRAMLAAAARKGETP